MQRHSPFPGNPLGSKVDQFQQGHVPGKGPFVLGHFPDLAVVALNHVGRIDHFSDRIRIPEVGRQFIPATSPRVDHHRIFLAPLLLQVQQVCLGLVFIHRLIDGL